MPIRPGNAIGFRIAHRIEHLRRVALQRMKEIVDDLGARAVALHGDDVGNRQIQHHRLDPRAAGRAEGGEEPIERVRRPPSRDPEDALRLDIDDERRVALPFVERKLVDGNPSHPGEVGRVHWPEPRGERAHMNLLDGIPADVNQGRDILNREPLGQARDRLGQALGHPLIAIEPRKLLAHRAAAGALEPGVRKDEPEIKAHEREIAHAPHGDIVHRLDRPATLTTALHRVGRRLELDDEPLGRQPERIGLEGLLRRPPSDLESVPPTD